MIKIIDRTQLTENTTGYELELDTGELDINETLDDRYQRYAEFIDGTFQE